MKQKYEFVSTGDGFTTVPVRERSKPILQLPPADYNVVFVPMSQSAPAHFKLERSSTERVLPTKLFNKSEIDYLTSKAIDLYKDNSHTTSGILFSGNYGSGKSITMRNIELEFIKMGVPVVRILEYPQDEMHLLKRFLGTIGPKLIVIDEFEKKFDTYQQEEMLDLFDGESTAPHTCIMLGVNRVEDINKGYIKRPGRIGLWFTSTYCSKATLDEIVAHYLTEKSHIEDINTWFDTFDGVTIDEVLSVVKVRKRYPKDDFTHLTSVLNVSRHYGTREFKVLEVAISVYDDNSDETVYAEKLTPEGTISLTREALGSQYACGVVTIGSFIKKKDVNMFKDLSGIDLNDTVGHFDSNIRQGTRVSSSAIRDVIRTVDPKDSNRHLRIFVEVAVKELH